MAELAQFLDQTQRRKVRDGLWALWLVHTSMQTILDMINVLFVTLKQWIKFFLPKTLFLSAVLPAHSSSTEMLLAGITVKSDRFSSPLPFLWQRKVTFVSCNPTLKHLWLPLGRIPSGQSWW